VSASEAEAHRRILQAANLIASAIRLGANPQEVASAVRSAVAEGAEQYAADVIEDYDKAVA
jgi:thiazole synthase ThiGH ThiG subunit